MTHEYESDPQSGAGNCTCGAARDHRRHPHTFRRVYARFGLAAILNAGTVHVCVCGLLPEADVHMASVTA